MVFGDYEEPCQGEDGGVGCVYYGVEDVERCEGDAFERRFGADVGSEVRCQGEGEGGVNVHGELERGQGKAG